MVQKLSSSNAKLWYRHRATGDLGFLATDVDGKEFIQLDRGAHVIRKPFSLGDWLEEREQRLMTSMQVAQIAYAADSELNRILHWEPHLTRAEWINMRASEKIDFRDNGPVGEVRRLLWKAVVESLILEMRDQNDC